MANNVNQESKQDLKSEQCCANCAKPLAPVRLDWSFVIDEMRKVVDLDKGILYTLKEVFLRPGASIRHYLTVDRNKFMRPLLFLVILSAISNYVTNPNEGQDESTLSSVTDAAEPASLLSSSTPNLDDDSITEQKNSDQNTEEQQNEAAASQEDITKLQFKRIGINFVSNNDGNSSNQVKFTETIKWLYRWTNENPGWTAVFFVVMFTPWIKLYFRKYDYNIIEISVMFCYITGVALTIAMLGGLIKIATKIDSYSIGQTLSNLYTIWAIGRFYEVNWKGYIRVTLTYITAMAFFVISAVLLAQSAIYLKLIS